MSGNANGALLSVNNVEVIYDHVILVLKGVSLEVPEGGVVALLGANGAGKTTTLKAISNLLRAERGDVTKGSIEYRGDRIDRLTASDLVKRLNEAQSRGELKNRAGQAVGEAMDEGLVREDGAYLYPIINGIPVMLIDEAIPLEGSQS